MKNSLLRKFIYLFLLVVIVGLFFPVFLKLNGDDCLYVECGEIYEDPGAEVFLNISEPRVKGSVDTSSVGEYSVKYTFLFESVTRKVIVKDTVKPEIVLKGMTNISIEKGSAYEEYGFTASDTVDGDLTDRVSIESDLDTETVGVYHISYYVSDNSGNKTRERRTVKVTENGPFTQSMPEFDLNPFYSDVICSEVPFSEEKYQNTVIVGDSFTGFMSEYEVGNLKNQWYRGAMSANRLFSETLSMYPEGDTGLTFFQLMEKNNPKNVILVLGNHDSWHWSVDYYELVMSDVISKCIEKYPDTTFVLCAMAPYDLATDYEYLPGRGFLRNQRINEANALYCELCRRYGLKFINVAECLKNPETGYCIDEYMGPDKFHLSKKGFEVYLDYIKTHMDW